MKAARLVVLGVALAAGGIAALLARGGHEPERRKAPVVAQMETVDVLVAKADLGRGQLIGSDGCRLADLAEGSRQSELHQKIERPNAINEFVGAIVRVSVANGEPIRDPQVVFAKGSGFMAAILPQGMRAVAMEISPENGAGGFILPDDHVDVVLTRRDKAAEKASGVEKFVSETILRNVRVLAVDQAVEEKNGQKVVVGKTATVELTQEQVETLALSHQLGSLSLALRSLLDSKSSVPEGGVERKEEVQISINTVRYGVSTVAATPH